MSKIILKNSIFEDIKHIDEEELEYWSARELQKVLGYKEWRKFNNIIGKAKTSCIKSGDNVLNHFVQLDKMVNIGSMTKRKIIDYKLSRYACYLIAQNGDSHLENIALAQTYFAIQARKQELLETNIDELTELERRKYQRDLTKKANLLLNKTASKSGVKNFDKFHNAGYKGLYNGETANDIAKRKNLRYREDILDNMGSVELAANLFRITQAESKIKNENIMGENNCNVAHNQIGKIVRKAIKEAGGLMPENLPTPNKSLKELKTNRETCKKMSQML